MAKLASKSVTLSTMIAISTVNLTSALPSQALPNSSSPGVGQPNRSVLKVQPVEGKLDPNQIRVIKQNPIQFQPFEVRDPQTGNPISPDTVLTLPDGRKVAAGKYYGELNKLEQQFNSIGYTLRSPQEKITIQETIIDQANLERQIKPAEAEHLKSNPNPNLILKDRLDSNKVLQSLQLEQKQKIAELQNQQITPEVLQNLLKQQALPGVIQAVPKQQIKPGGLQIPTQQQINPNILQTLQNQQIDSNVIQSLQTLQNQQKLQLSPAVIDAILKLNLPKTYNSSRNWNYSTGNSTFSAYINGRLELSAKKYLLTPKNDVTSINGEANAGGSIFSQNLKLLRATNNLTSPASGAVNAKLNVFVVGQNVYNFDQNGNGGLFKSDSVSQPLDVSTKIYFSLGPIPMSATIGAQGEAGLNYFVGMIPASAYTKLDPFVHSKVYVQAGVDVVVAGAGAGANMILLNNDLNLAGQMAIKLDSPNKPYFYTWLYGYDELEMLSGNLYAYAYIYVPRFGIPPWKKKEWDWTIWNWTGFKTKGYLFNNEYKTYL